MHLLCPHWLEIHSPGPSDWCPGIERSRSGPTLPVVCCWLFVVVVVVVVVVPKIMANTCARIRFTNMLVRNNTMTTQLIYKKAWLSLLILCTPYVRVIWIQFWKKKVSTTTQTIYSTSKSILISWISMNETRLSTKRMNTKSSHPTKTSNHPQKRNAQTPKRLKKKRPNPRCVLLEFFTTEKPIEIRTWNPSDQLHAPHSMAHCNLSKGKATKPVNLGWTFWRFCVFW